VDETGGIYARMEEWRNGMRSCNNLEDLGTYGRIILKLILVK
jgi:hypothetical protein